MAEHNVFTWIGDFRVSGEVKVALNSAHARAQTSRIDSLDLAAALIENSKFSSRQKNIRSVFGEELAARILGYPLDGTRAIANGDLTRDASRALDKALGLSYGHAYSDLEARHLLCALIGDPTSKLMRAISEHEPPTKVRRRFLVWISNCFSNDYQHFQAFLSTVDLYLATDSGARSQQSELPTKADLSTEVALSEAMEFGFDEERKPQVKGVANSTYDIPQTITCALAGDGSVTFTDSNGGVISGPGAIPLVKTLLKDRSTILVADGIDPSALATQLGGVVPERALIISKGDPEYRLIFGEPPKHVETATTTSERDVGPIEPLSLHPLGKRQEHAFVCTDESTNVDLLNLTHEINAFAKVIAAETIKAPLAIGLFGSWGSGKSSFMELVHDEVAMISNQAKQQKKPGYLQNIAQIKFNAWHYMDSNLWASLVGHIFQNLGSKLGTAATEAIDLTVLGGQLSEAKIKLEEAREMELAAAAKLESGHSEIVEATRKLEAAKATLEGVRLRHIVEIAKQDETIVTLANEAKSMFGFQDIGELLQRADQESGQIAGLYRGSKGALAVLSTRWWIALLVLGFALVPYWLPYLIQNLHVPTLLNVAWIISVAGGGLAKVERITHKGSDALGKMQSLISILEEKKTAELKRDVHAAEDKLTEVRKQADGMAKQVSTATADVARIESRIKDLKSGALLEKFLRERAEADDYKRHGGIISMIRRDFETLSDYMWQRSDAQETSVSRIVLYIDDLDRCPPDRVVEVLQAIHLLLGFKLFVVVVGIDPAWMNRSIKMYYKDKMKLGESADEAEEAVLAPARYLEKIFQIPFSLRPMRELSRHDLVASLIGEPSASEKRDLLDSIGANSLDEPPISNFDDADEVQASSSPVMHVESESHPELMLAAPIELNERERELIRMYVDCMPSPRALKRFVNTFHLLKALHRDTSDWEPHMACIALALLIACPRGARVLKHVPIESATSLQQTLIEAARSSCGPDSTEERFLTDLMPEPTMINAGFGRIARLTLRFSFEPS